MKFLRFYKSILICLLLQVSFSVYADDQLKSDVRALLTTIVKGTDAPSLSVAAAKDGVPLFAVAVGMADKSNGIQATSETQYRTGSVAKVIGTTAFMKLVEEGRVKLSDPIRMYLPYMPNHYQPVNINHLLTHTGGVRHYNYGEYGTNIRYATLEEATRVFRDSQLLFAPGTGFNYTTYGINLIQGVIEKVSGQPLDVYLENTLFAPYGMHKTEPEIKGREKETYAVGYRSFLSSMPVKEVDVSNKYIGGGMRSTPADLVRMITAVNAGDVLSKDTVATMLSKPFPVAAPDRGYGWRWFEYDGKRAFGHSGAVNGFESFLLHFMEENITIALMVNQDNYDHTSSSLFKVLDLIR